MDSRLSVPYSNLKGVLAAGLGMHKETDRALSAAFRLTAALRLSALATAALAFAVGP